MFKKLKQHWRVNNLGLALIITTFAFGGSLCGYTGRRLLNLLHIDKGFIWISLYIILIILLWPLCVILISIPFGQFYFFKKYIVKVFKRLGGSSRPASFQIAIFASGKGTNAQQIIDHFAGFNSVKVVLIICNKPDAGVLSIAQIENIPAILIERDRFFNGDHYRAELEKAGIDLIVLAGFLWKMPEELIRAYPKKIVNIHPALLPKYGGQGMYGHFVHEAIIANKEKESGITVHYVDEQYDHGEIIFQAKCAVGANDTPENLAQNIHVLEHKHYPVVIEKVMKEIQEKH